MEDAQQRLAHGESKLAALPAQLDSLVAQQQTKLEIAELKEKGKRWRRGVCECVCVCACIEFVCLCGFSRINMSMVGTILIVFFQLVS